MIVYGNVFRVIILGEFSEQETPFPTPDSRIDFNAAAKVLSRQIPVPGFASVQQD